MRAMSPSRQWNRMTHVARILVVLAICSRLPTSSADWVDTDTPLDKRTTTSLIDGTTYHLVSMFYACSCACVNVLWFERTHYVCVYCF